MSQSWSLEKIFNPQPGWYRGELHAHSSHSDGYHSPAKLAQFAKTADLDFLAITDHNRIDAYIQLSQTPDFLIVPGIEITLQNGHFNIYGLTRWYKWMENICIGLNTIKLSGKYPTTTELMRRTAGQGLLNSINHPFRVPFNWRDEATELSHVHCLEIWNKPDAPDPNRTNPKAIKLWTKMLNAGYRLTAVGGSDHHVMELRPGEVRATERLGWPRNYVYVEELSAAAILDSLRQHRVYVSMGPTVNFQAHLNGQPYQIGSVLGEVDGQLQLTAQVVDSPMPGRAQIVKNGEVMTEVALENGCACLKFSDEAKPSQTAWYRLDVYNEADLMLALTNPIYVGPRCQPDKQTFGEFVQDM